MAMSGIVVIVLRLFALNWLATALPLLLSTAISPAFRGPDLAVGLLPYTPGLLLLTLAAALWFVARPIARIVTHSGDASVSMSGLSRSDLYSFAFVFLGLFFILSSFADVVNWIHYFTVSRDVPTRDPRVQNFYDLTRPCITVALGAISLLGAPRWTKKLLARDQTTQAT
jgi:hypothetical protein